jgi:probable rRNA maturation factor
VKRAKSSKSAILIHHRQRTFSYDRPLLEKIVHAAWPDCLKIAQKNNAELSTLESVEVSILGTRAMAQVHRDFLNIPGATDVITFPYGEILVCAPVAAARAREFGNTPTIELALYIIHGLLHLSGHDDIEPAQAKAMSVMQQKILEAALTRVTGK